MKKFFIFVAALVALMSLSVYANDIVIVIKSGGLSSHPRSELPVITARIDNDNICKTNVSEYSGNIAVAVKNAAGDTLISHTEAVFDSTQIMTDVSSLEDGSYTITYTLEDSTVLGGDFEKE